MKLLRFEGKGKKRTSSGKLYKSKPELEEETNYRHGVRLIGFLPIVTLRKPHKRGRSMARKPLAEASPSSGSLYFGS